MSRPAPHKAVPSPPPVSGKRGWASPPPPQPVRNRCPSTQLTPRPSPNAPAPTGESPGSWEGEASALPSAPLRTSMGQDRVEASPSLISPSKGDWERGLAGQRWKNSLVQCQGKEGQVLPCPSHGPPARSRGVSKMRPAQQTEHRGQAQWYRWANPAGQPGVCSGVLPAQGG